MEDLEAQIKKMYKIIVKGEAKAKIGEDWKTIEDRSILEKLNGIDCQDNFSECFDKTSYSKDITGGYMDFRFEDGKLWTYTEYDSKRMLSFEELHDLQEYTQGQWSDGIGEGFEQHPCTEINGEEVFISSWFSGQEISITQKEI